jgi:hypothetical protein
LGLGALGGGLGLAGADFFDAVIWLSADVDRRVARAAQDLSSVAPAWEVPASVQALVAVGLASPTSNSS